MRVLLAGDYDGTFKKAFTEEGHTCLSCPVERVSGTQYDYVDDLLNPFRSGPWGLIILMPPTKELCIRGNRWYAEGKPLNYARRSALEWADRLWEEAIANSPRVIRVTPLTVMPRSQLVRYFPDPTDPCHTQPGKLALKFYGVRSMTTGKLPPSPTYKEVAKEMARQYGSGSKDSFVRTKSFEDEYYGR